MNHLQNSTTNDDENQQHVTSGGADERDTCNGSSSSSYDEDEDVDDNFAGGGSIIPLTSLPASTTGYSDNDNDSAAGLFRHDERHQPPPQHSSHHYGRFCCCFCYWCPQRLQGQRIRTLLQQGWHNNNMQLHWKILVAGQVLSFFLACQGAAQATLNLNCHISVPPMFTVGLFYAALAVTMMPLLIVLDYCDRRRHERNNKQQQSSAHTMIATSEEEFSTTREADGADNSTDDNNTVIGGTDTLTLDDNDDDPSENDNHPSSSSSSSPQYSFLKVVPLHAPAWSYLPVSLTDVYANYVTVLAYKYTTITSVTLFDALAIPTSMLLSKIFLHRRYTALHYISVVSCLTGICLNVYQDYQTDLANHQQQGKNNGSTIMDNNDWIATMEYYPHRLWGDILAISGGLLWGLNNVLGEYAVRHQGGVVEYLAMLGMYASVVCGIQAALTERDEIAAIIFAASSSDSSSSSSDSSCSPSTAAWLLTVFALTNYFCYVGGSKFLQVSEAAFFNLSLLTGDFWSVGFSVIAQRIVPARLFFVALVLILSGVVVYEMAASPIVVNNNNNDDDDDDHDHHPRDDDDNDGDDEVTFETTTNHQNPEQEEHQPHHDLGGHCDIDVDVDEAARNLRRGARPEDGGILT